MASVTACRRERARPSSRLVAPRAAIACPPEHGGRWRRRGIRDRATFEALRGSRARGRCGVVAVTYAPGPPDVQIAFAVGRRVGGAVARNRIRRRLRAVLRELPLAPGAYLVSAGPEATTVAFEELRAQLGTAVQRAVGHGARP